MLLRINPILIAAAAVPAALLMLYVYRKDRLEREPGSLLWRLILQGILATAMAAWLEKLGIALLEWITSEDTAWTTVFLTFLIVGPVEEGCKYLLLKLRTWRNPNFNCRFDGVVYAVFISLGFAMWENISYVAAYGLRVAALRAVTAVPGHACFGVFMGAWYGQAKALAAKGDEAGSLRCRLLALIVPILLHAVYDCVALLGGPLASLIFLVFILLMFLVAWMTLRRLSKTDSYL